MPLFYQHNINEYCRLAIWRIEEPESFFLAKVPLKRDVSHPHKRLQHLAGRYLLSILFDDFPQEEIVIADTRKPFLENEKYHFSISHCGDFAAAIVSAENRVGVDIELMTDKISRISHKFLSPAEYELALRGTGELQTPDFKLQTILWSSKEAIFKWYSLGEMDFKEHMKLRQPMTQIRDGEWLLYFMFTKSKTVDLSIHAKIFDGLVLAWVVT